MSERQMTETDPRDELEKARGRIAELEGENTRLLREATQFRKLLMASLESLIVVQDGRFVFFTASFADLVSYPAAEFSATDFARFVHPEDRAGLMQRYAEALASSTPSEEYEFRTVAKNGAVRWYGIRGVACEWNGEPALLCSLRERTSEKNAEAKYRDLLEIVPIAVFETDLETGRFLRVNDVTCATLGYTRGELMAMAPIDVIAPEERALYNERIGLKRQSQPLSPTVEYRILAKDGREVWVLLSSKVVRHADGRTTSLLVAQDITERKRAEEERRRLEAQVLEKQKLESLGALAAGIAHDFNNLLAVIVGNGLLARSEAPAGSSLAERLDQIRLAAEHAKALTSQMLMYAGKGSPSLGPLDLSGLVGGMAELLKASVAKECRLETCLGQGPLMIEGDPTQLRQVIMNLVTNGSEALCDRPGQVGVSTGVMHADTAYLTRALEGRDLVEGSYVYLEVSDTGQGMEEETRQRLFEPYFSTKSTSRGLGLASVLGIVRGHGGAINVTTQPAKGTTFRVLFPPVSHAARPAQREVRPRGAAAKESTVLVVDDEEAALRLARGFLEGGEFKVLTAEGGRRALEILRGDLGERIHAVVLDLAMPDLDGRETFLEIRALRPGLPVIVVSGLSEKAAAARFPLDEVSAFLRKPYQPTDLIDAVRASLGD